MGLSLNRSLVFVAHILTGVVGESFQVYEDYLKVVFLLMQLVDFPSQHDEPSHKCHGSFCQVQQFASLYQQLTILSQPSL